MTARGTTYLQTVLSPFQAAMPRIIDRGYMKMRWNQHSSQGSSPNICEKYRLPKVAVRATMNASSNPCFEKNRNICRNPFLKKHAMITRIMTMSATKVRSSNAGNSETMLNCQASKYKKLLLQHITELFIYYS
jgi:hypothetical protein